MADPRFVIRGAFTIDFSTPTLTRNLNEHLIFVNVNETTLLKLFQFFFLLSTLSLIWNMILIFST
jgi:hypothetical protein